MLGDVEGDKDGIVFVPTKEQGPLAGHDFGHDAGQLHPVLVSGAVLATMRAVPDIDACFDGFGFFRFEDQKPKWVRACRDDGLITAGRRSIEQPFKELWFR